MNKTITLSGNDYESDYSDRFHEEIYTVRRRDLDQLLMLHDKLLDFAGSYIKSWKLHAKGPSPEFTKEVSNTHRLASDKEIKSAIAKRKRL